MEAKFTFDVDRSLGLVRISMHGFYGLKDVAAFFSARRLAHARLGLPRNEHVTLNDIRGMKIQHQEVVAAFQAGLAVPEEKARKTAIVVVTSLARAQALRAVSDPSVRYFTDVAEAEAWLLADEECEAPLRAAGGAR
jgi:hypothetical protein